VEGREKEKWRHPKDKLKQKTEEGKGTRMYAAEYDKIRKELDRYMEDRDDGRKWVDTVNRYRNLRAVLEKAFERAAFGKGATRHARGDEPFEKQQILEATRFYGDGGLYFQMEKKLRESFRLTGEQKINELLDVVIYACAAVLYERELNR
jgi:hypothetical protein